MIKFYSPNIFDKKHRQNTYLHDNRYFLTFFQCIFFQKQIYSKKERAKKMPFLYYIVNQYVKYTALILVFVV